MEESQSVRNLAVDPVEEKMYFMRSWEIVSRANFDGSEKEIIRESGVKAFAVDSVERRMYWMDNFGTIYKGNMNFSEGQEIIYDAFVNNLVIDPYSRLVMHFLKTHTLPETCMGQSKLCKNLLLLSNSLSALRMHVAMFRESPKKYIFSNFLVVVISIPGHYTEGINS